MPNSHHQDEALVVKQFESQLELYTSQGSGAKAELIDYVVDYLSEIQTVQHVPHICEFGGGSGATLAEIESRCTGRAPKSDQKKAGLRLSNAELVAAYAQHQVNPNIEFEATSILNSPFADDTFDVVFSRHVYHHLVGDTLMHTRKNQQRAIDEMCRVVKPGGIVVIEEQTNQLRLANWLIFWGSNLATILNPPVA